MLAHQRQERILEQVRLHGGVRVADLVEMLGVSDMTVRRDIAELAAQGLVQRVHGGASAPSGRATDEPGFAAKRTLHIAAKEAVAARAAQLVAPGSSVALSGGTTTWAVAAHLRQVPDLTVVTNSVPVADLLHTAARPDLTVILTGGVRTPSDSLVGPVAEASLARLHVDQLFLGVHGIDADAGLSTPNLDESATNRALLACARRVVVTADSSKWGVVALSSMADLTEVDAWITDDGLDPAAHDAVAERGVRLTTVPVTAKPARG